MAKSMKISKYLCFTLYYVIYVESLNMKMDGGDVPLPIDKSVSANIERIRLKRNKYGHSTDISQTHMNLILFYKLPKTTIKCKRSFVVNSYKFRDER